MSALMAVVALAWGGFMGYLSGSNAREVEIYQACDKSGNFVVVHRGAAHIYSCRKVSP